MCVGFWTLDDPEYALILCANRDEFLSRPATAAAFHHAFSPNPNTSPTSGAIRVLSGLDAEAGGTWLGVAPSTGRIALLTNITEPAPVPAPPRSRGELGALFLAQTPSSADLGLGLDELYPKNGKYAGFNMLLLQASERSEEVEFAPNGAAFVSNGGAHGPIAHRLLRNDERALGGLSNGIQVTDTAGESWVKVATGREKFRATIDAFRGRQELELAHEKDLALASSLFALLRTPPAEPPTKREELRNAICVPPLPIAVGRYKGYYATRTATVVLIRRKGGDGLFVERDVWGLDQREGEEAGVSLRDGEDEQRVLQFRVAEGE
ncbi:hypothetical protein HMN09_00992900 [Mycena chlorophos]|uniref:DUF833-domain-containing protein n=1 Tax=Mycena chlorophos TaxID=658473 RepID=A0A8H6W5D0_MYCCL|nr:hypothetical protein HMN09_00992900 [Mycena chlorophos]